MARLKCCHETETAIYAARTNLPIFDFQTWHVCSPMSQHSNCRNTPMSQHSNCRNTPMSQHSLVTLIGKSLYCLSEKVCRTYELGQYESESVCRRAQVVVLVKKGRQKLLREQRRHRVTTGQLVQ